MGTARNSASTFDGEPCIKCAATRRYVSSGGCTACQRVSADRVRASNQMAGFCSSHPSVPVTSGTVCVVCSEKNRLNQRLRVYGETGVERLAAQGGRCAICRKRIRIDHPRTHIDHCHVCKMVRSVLCGPCNTIEGFVSKFSDVRAYLARLLNYIEWSQTDCPGHDTMDTMCDEAEDIPFFGEEAA